jgi:hypothetical protein
MKYDLPEYENMAESDLPSEFKSPVPPGFKWGRIEELEQTVYLLRHWRNVEELALADKLKEQEATIAELKKTIEEMKKDNVKEEIQK